MPHVLIVGKTESGKTTLAKQLAAGYQAKGIPVIVLDPMLDNWPADIITDDKTRFNAIVKHPDTQGCAIFVDESGEAIGRYDQEMVWLATRARHYGHNSHFIVQRTTMLNKTICTQCRYLYLFNCTFSDAKMLSEDFAGFDPREVVNLPQFHYFFCNSWGIAQKRVLKPNF